MSLATRVQQFRPSREFTLGLTGLVVLEVSLIGLYIRFSSGTITDPLILLYPFIWINVSVWAVLTTGPPSVSTRHRWIAGAIGVGYFVLLAAVGGLVTPGHAFHGHTHASSFRLVLTTLPPGWAPAILYGGSFIGLALFPFRLIGYLALAYLVYVTLLDAAGSVVSGLIGLFSCVSCTWPVLGTVLTSVFGGTSAVALVAMNRPYGVSTLVFLSAVALLYWRPLR